MSGKKPDGIKAAWNEYNEARSVRQALEKNPDPAQPGYSGPPVVALMGYRGPYPVQEHPKRREAPKPNPESLERSLTELRRTNALRREVAQEFDGFGWLR